ncbi:MAG: heparan-alpha-glucosaminide N-acetyltransferase domain-containing protein [bacterium]
MSSSLPNPSEVPPPAAPFAGVSPQAVSPARGRIDSIDLLRGIVMVIMMLDHTRDFVSRDAYLFDPTDLSKTNVALFLTRWITHFCAPVFVFLAGTGTYLQFSRGKSKRHLSRFLVTRGLWLIVLEFTLVRLGASFNVDYSEFFGMMQVIWVIGVSMIVLAALIHLPLKIIGGFGVAMIALHNLLDRFHVQGWTGPQSPVPGIWAKLFIILHQAYEPLPILWFFPSPVVFVLYPLIPWIGVIAAGYAFGALYQMSAERRRRWLWIMGSVATLLFILMRALNHYGDPSRWSEQAAPSFTFISFLNTTKYPPSLLYLLMTLGPALLALAWFEASNAAASSSGRSLASSIRNFFVTFGRVPLFFYLLQWPTAHFIAVLLHVAAGKPWRWMFGSQIGNNGPPPGVGFSLWVVYACWIVGILLLYPLCKWFAGVKARRRDWWLSYL